MKAFDVIIIGGGMVGSTAAICLAKIGLQVALIENHQPQSVKRTSFDQRAVALSVASVTIYKTLGLWDCFESIANPIKRIMVSDKGHSGLTRLEAAKHQLEDFGQVVSLDQAGPELWKKLDEFGEIKVFCPARVTQVNNNENTCEVVVSHENKEARLSAKLVLAADGTYSSTAESLNMDIERKPYNQSAVIANIKLSENHIDTAYERFTSGGPLALLPLKDNLMSLVWCHQSDDCEQIMALSDKEFIEKLQKAFGYRLGRVEKVGKRFSYPLSLHLAKNPVAGRVLLTGNAAHTLHPIAGQGLNLCLRDIAALTDTLRESILKQIDIGSSEVLSNFVATRQKDWQQSILATDGLARLFSQQWLPVVLLRNKLMHHVNRLPFFKNRLVKSATGYGSRASRLARGLDVSFSVDLVKTGE
ncbi:MAG: 2-octaprenyl-6-methoxyphenyl hydroxylase [Gammaproteobacteria bacterium]|nr:2-octaprenyl-6-methoxyphenyl hydroxylase [Gammaproteobacteria bacterium]MDH5628866.1 2-octaprenyl-6-methoxyphenyl hydroxylase [Gammaproteobacteria bacterium]